jgi:hypothetical protein
VYLCSDLDEVTWRGPENAQDNLKNRELEHAIVARDITVAVAARNGARYHANLQAVEAEEEAAKRSTGTPL